jgi:hypothetical protein
MNKNIVSVIVLVIFFSWVYFFTPSYNDSQCNKLKDFKKLYINGVVIKKYIDSQEHSYPMIFIKNFNSNDTVNLNLVFDTTNLFNVLKESDTVYKDRNKLDLYISNNGKSVFFNRIDFGCIGK